MASLVFSHEESVVGSLHQFCQDLRDKEIFVCEDIATAREILEREGPRINLVLTSWGPQVPAFCAALLEYEEKFPAFRSAPLVQILPYRPAVPQSWVSALSNATRGGATRDERNNRIDSFLIRPFDRSRFQAAVKTAYERRALLRSTILLLGDSIGSGALKLLQSAEKSAPGHWTSALLAHKKEDLSSRLDKHGSKIGAIVIEPSSTDATLLQQVSAFRKMPLGRQLPIIVLGQNAETVASLRSFADVFMDFDLQNSSRAESVRAALELASQRLTTNWIVQEFMERHKEFLKQEHEKKLPANSTDNTKWPRWISFFKKTDMPLKLLKKALETDPRWEIHESLGRLLMKRGRKDLAIRHFQQALETYPCSPRAYLSLMELLDPNSQAYSELIRRAQLYCPNVPQVRESLGNGKKAS
jgi:tetratricopeptide (TPR) repeat protein